MDAMDVNHEYGGEGQVVNSPSQGPNTDIEEFQEYYDRAMDQEQRSPDHEPS